MLEENPDLLQKYNIVKSWGKIKNSILCKKEALFSNFNRDQTVTKCWSYL
jgi:hypothetical protein